MVVLLMWLLTNFACCQGREKGSYTVERLQNGDVVTSSLRQVTSANCSEGQCKCSNNGTWYARVDFERAKCYYQREGSDNEYGSKEKALFSQLVFFALRNSSDGSWTIPPVKMPKRSRLRENPGGPHSRSPGGRLHRGLKLCLRDAKITQVQYFSYDRWLDHLNPPKVMLNMEKKRVAIKPAVINSETHNLSGEILRFTINCVQGTKVFYIKFQGSKTHNADDNTPTAALLSYHSGEIIVRRERNGDVILNDGSVECRTMYAESVYRACRCKNGGTFVTEGVRQNRCYDFKQLARSTSANTRILTVKDAANVVYAEWHENTGWTLPPLPVLVSFENLTLRRQSCGRLSGQSNRLVKNEVYEASQGDNLIVSVEPFRQKGFILKLSASAKHDLIRLRGQLMQGHFSCDHSNNDVTYTYYVKFSGKTKLLHVEEEHLSRKYTGFIVGFVMGLFVFFMLLLSLVLYRRKKKLKTDIRINSIKKQSTVCQKHVQGEILRLQEIKYELNEHEQEDILRLAQDIVRIKSQQDLTTPAYIRPSLLPRPLSLSSDPRPLVGPLSAAFQQKQGERGGDLAEPHEPSETYVTPLTTTTSLASSIHSELSLQSDSTYLKHYDISFNEALEDRYLSLIDDEPTEDYYSKPSISKDESYLDVDHYSVPDQNYLGLA